MMMREGRIVSIGVCALGLAWSAAADTVHKVRFAQDARVLVWQNETLIGDGAEIVLLQPLSDAPIDIPGDGQLDPIDRGSWPNAVTFEIASNAGFVIETSDTGMAASISVRVIDQAANAQLASQPTISGDTIIFHQAAKTAIRPGSPLSQSLTIQVSWTQRAPSSLSVRAL